MNTSRIVVAALALAALVIPSTSAFAGRPDRPPVSYIAVSQDVNVGTGYFFEVAHSSLGTDTFAGVECVGQLEGGGSVRIAALMLDPDSLSSKANKLSSKQSNYPYVQASFCDPSNTCNSTATPQINGCSGSVKLTDVEKNLSFTDATDKGSFALECEDGALQGPLTLTEPQIADLAAAFPDGVQCKGKGAPFFGCFRGDTKVATEAGLRSIRDIRVGDRVWSWDDAKKEKVLSRVTQTFAYPAREMRTLIAGTETFHVTDRHPFWVDGRGWVEAAKLATGDRLRTSGNELVAVRSNERADFIAFYKGYDPSMDRQSALRHPFFQLQRVALGTPTAESGIVYNIEVGDVHNYYVGDAGILVHNK